MATGSSFIIFAAIALMSGKLDNVQADCRSDIQNITSQLILPIQENSLEGTIIKVITTDYTNLHSTVPSDGFLTITNGSIVAKIDVFLDGPQKAATCTSSKQDNQPTLEFYCTGEPNSKKVVNSYINYTDDYAPSFTVFETNVNESAPIGFAVFDLTSIVRDDDCTNAFNFFIEGPPNELFQVRANKLELLQNLDYERNTTHVIDVTVSSSIQNGAASMSNKTALTVHVLDVDDMSPVFEVNQFLLRVPEEQDLSGTWLNTTPPILATDGDVGINTTLIYSITSITPNLNLEINNETGQVKLLDKLDRENIRAYIVVVKAAQADVSYRTATATLSILVDDVNDNRPVYTSESHATIMEDAPDGSYVMELTGEDRDEGDNSLFEFIITSDSTGAFKTNIPPGTNRTILVVDNSTALRGQVQAVVQFYLRERLPAVAPACSNTSTCIGSVTIDITDVNDNTPMFNSTTYNFTLPSNTSGHYDIGQVFATDADRGSNAVIKYSSTLVTGPPDCSLITLDATSGVLATDQQLPPGAKCSWIATACDSPTDPNARRCSSVPLTVSVIPSGNVLENSATLPENVPIGTMVKALPITGLHTTSTEFEIRNDVLYTKVLLDREREASYEVSILSGQNGNSVVMIIYVNISDVNDNAPVFGQSVYVINMDSSWKINQTLLQVNASDADTGTNARLAFSMATGKDYFDIDPTTGQIQLINFPTTRDSEYQLLVTDFGQPSLSSLASLKVYNPVHNETAVILLPVSKDVLMADRDGLARKLGLILGLSVKVYNIESLSPAPDVGSKVYISATSAQGQSISPTELNKLLETHAMEIYDAFAKPKQASEDSNDKALSVLEIVLICLASVLLLLLLLAAFLWYRSNRKLRQSRRLFDSLNKDTTIYDNPRKPSSSAAVIASSNNNSTNAQRMMARLSSGSVGNSSVTNLLPTQGDGGDPTPPGSNSSQRRQQSHQYENVLNAPLSNPVITDYENVLNSPLSNPVINDDDGMEDTLPVETNEEQITTFSSQIENENLTNTNHPHIATVGDESNQDGYIPAETWSGNNTTFSGRRNSDVDSGTISDKETQLEDADEDDQEVADILSETSSTPLSHSHGDTADSPANRSNLDLMTAPTQLEDAHPAGVDNPGYVDTENPNSNLPPEPEPDYAKKVRFSDATATMDTNETENSPDDNNKDMSLAKFLNQYGGAENLATYTDTTQNSYEEMTAL